MTTNHFTATGIVFNSEGKILMIHHKKLQVWLPPGGHIEANELPDDAVVREVFEETGVKANIIPTPKLLKDKEDGYRELSSPFVIFLENIEGDWTHNHIDMVYLCEALNEELSAQESEVNGIGWFTLSEIVRLDTFDNVLCTISKAVDYLHAI